jgi:hypothetical protein
MLSFFVICLDVLCFAFTDSVVVLKFKLQDELFSSLQTVYVTIDIFWYFLSIPFTVLYRAFNFNQERFFCDFLL